MELSLGYKQYISTIIELLPYSNDTVFTNRQQKLEALKLMCSVIEFSIKGLEKFISFDLSLFDAQVGDNLCQIRAYMILRLAEKWLIDPEKYDSFLNDVNTIRKYLNNLRSLRYQWENSVNKKVQREENLDSNESIYTFLSRQNLLINLQEDVIFLIMCYFLTYVAVREEMIPIAINYEKILNEMKISQYRAKRIIHKYQLTISKMGCDFILNSAKAPYIDKRYLNVLPNLCRISDENRIVLPCMIVMDIILTNCINNKIPILCIANLKNRNFKTSDVVYFLLNGKEKVLELEKYDHNPTKCLVISGDSIITENQSNFQFVKKFLNFNPYTLILANMASHPQYSGKRLAEFRDNPFLDLNDADNLMVTEVQKQLTELRIFAHTIGCSKENQSTWFLRHIYPSSVSFEINQLYSNEDIKVSDARDILKDNKRYREIKCQIKEALN